MFQLCQVNGHILENYPEILQSMNKIKHILDHEVELIGHQVSREHNAYPKLQNTYPKLAASVEQKDAATILEAIAILQKTTSLKGTIDGDLAFHLYESTGIRPKLIKILAEALHMEFDKFTFEHTFSVRQSLSRKSSSRKIAEAKYNAFRHGKNVYTLFPDNCLEGIPITQDNLKYNYHRKEQNGGHTYALPMVKSKVLAVSSGFEGRKMQCLLYTGEEAIRPKHGVLAVILDQTTFFSEGGGQVGDTGVLVGYHDSTFEVKDTKKLPSGHVLHIGKVTQGVFHVGGNVVVKIDPAHRVAVMQNHTGTHLINYVLHSLLPVTSQRSSHVTPKGLRFDFSVYACQFDLDDVYRVEARVNALIGSGGEVDIRDVKLGEAKDLTTIPGERYPEVVRVVRMGSAGVEPCCGTHLHNISDVQALTVIDCKAGTGTRSLRCITGLAAIEARKLGMKILDQVADLADGIEDVDVLTAKEVAAIQKELRGIQKQCSRETIPYAVRCEVDGIADQLMRHFKSKDKSSLKTRMESELVKAMEETWNNQGFVVHPFSEVSDTNISLSKITALCKDKPILVLRRGQDGTLFARAVIPPFMQPSIRANDWMNQAFTIGADDELMAKAPKGQDPSHMVNMKLKPQDPKRVMEDVTQAATQIGLEHFAGK